MSTRDFIGPSGGRLARAKLETPTSAAIHAATRRRRRRSARAKFPAFRATFDGEPPGFAAPGLVVAPRFVSDADDGETRSARARRGAVRVDFARGARRRTRMRKNVLRSRSTRRVAKRAFSNGARRLANLRRFDRVSRDGRASSTARKRNAFSDGKRGGSDACGESRRGASRQTLASSRRRDASTVDFGVAAPWSERGFYGAAPRDDFAPKRVASTRRFVSRQTRDALDARFETGLIPRRTRVGFQSPARRAFVTSARERTRRASGFHARRRPTASGIARNGAGRWERADAASSLFCEGRARRFGRLLRGVDERRGFWGNGTRRAGFGAASEFTAPRNASFRAPSRFARRRVPTALDGRPAPRFGRVGAASFPRIRGARDGEGRRRGSSSDIYRESDAFYGAIPTFAAFIPPSRGNVEPFAFAPRDSTRTWSASETDFDADFGAFDDAALNRAASSEPGTARLASRRFGVAPDWRLPFPGIDGIAERATSSRRRRERTGEMERFGTRGAAVGSASGDASWRGADGIDGRAGDARELATIERLLKESRDALVALARDATGDLTLTTE